MDAQTTTALVSAFLGAVVGGGASFGTTAWSLNKTQRHNLALSEHQHRLGRRAAMARVSVWADLEHGQLVVANNSGEPLNGLQVDVTLLRGSDIDNVTMEGHLDISVGYVPPTVEPVTRPLPTDWLFPVEYALGQAFCLLETQFQDALGDFWSIGADGAVTLKQTAKELNEELLTIANAGGFDEDAPGS